MSRVHTIRRAFYVIGLIAVTIAIYLIRCLGLAFQGKYASHHKALFANTALHLFRQLGATFIKVGQIMSTRPDLFSTELIQALSHLQDNVGPFPFEEARKVIEAEFQKPIDSLYLTFDPFPIASASIAQVHQATLLDGTKVAVKIQRPGVSKLCDVDLAIMHSYAKVLSFVPSFALLAPIESVEQFAQAIRMQLDFITEASNNKRFQNNFRSFHGIRFPLLHDALSSKRVMTMEFIQGYKLTDYARVGADPKQLAKTGFQAMLKMVFIDGFIHADLHPGNILLTQAGDLALLDLGMVATLSEADRIIFFQYFLAWAQSDGETMAEILLQHAPSPFSCKNPKGFTLAMKAFVEQYQGKKLNEVEVTGVVFSMLRIFRKFHIRLNPTFTMVNIAIALTEGIGKQLSPELDLLQEALPFFTSGVPDKNMGST